MKFSTLSALICVAAASAQSPVVTVLNGPIAGTTTVVRPASGSASAATVTKYIGVPFASNPPLRFAPPVAASSWTTTLQAVTTQPACIQQFNPAISDREQQVFNNPGGPRPNESESCLFLNVYVPPNTKAGAALPVMFWVFGGNLAFGDGGLLLYDGSSFAANQNVVLVTHNYRTNIFGFSMSPDLPLTSRNAGFLDQRMALQWVYNNIAAFGGDPSKITIFGESAGGFSVEQLLAYPPFPQNFRGAILESRGFAGPGAVSTSWSEAVAAAGCALSINELACMRSKTAAQLKTAVQNLSFGPVQDGKTYTSDIRNRLGFGAAKVPIMLGTNGQEGNVFAYILGLDNPNANATAALSKFFGNSTLVNLLLSTANNTGNTPYNLVSSIITDYTFTCTTSVLASTLQNAGYNVWRYYFNASFPNTNVFSNAGAYHTTEIPEVFGTYASLGAPTQQQIALSQYMQTAWANFAKNPTIGPQLGWPTLGLGNVQDLGGNGASSGYTIPSSQIDYVCAGYDPIILTSGF